MLDDEKLVPSSVSELTEEAKEKAAEAITTALTTADTSSLNQEALTIINQLITEQDVNKQKDLAYLFTQNQNKKTMVRVNKMSDLLDAITEQAMIRFTTKPDEISNKEMIDAMKTVSDLIEKGQKQVSGNDQEAPFIQVNQQNNNFGDGKEPGPNRESRDRVKNAVLSLLNEIAAGNVSEADIIDAGEEKHD